MDFEKMPQGEQPSLGLFDARIGRGDDVSCAQTELAPDHPLAGFRVAFDDDAFEHVARLERRVVEAGAVARWRRRQQFGPLDVFAENAGRQVGPARRRWPLTNAFWSLRFALPLCPRLSRPPDHQYPQPSHKACDREPTSHAPTIS